jgi:nicotinamide-nucleotide amidase
MTSAKTTFNKIGTTLIANKQTIAVAESVTAGAVQLMLSRIPDAADFFQGGLTAYNIGQKYKHLNVEPIHAKAVHCVSQQVAEQMALTICTQFGSDWGLSITGYATPVAESGNQVFAFYAIAYHGKIKKKGAIKPQPAKPEVVQLHYAEYMLKKLLTLL